MQARSGKDLFRELTLQVTHERVKPGVQHAAGHEVTGDVPGSGQR